MTYVRDFVDASESIVSDNRLYFFREMHANVMEIYNKLGNNAHLRTIYIDVAKVLFNSKIRLESFLIISSISFQLTSCISIIKQLETNGN